MAGLLMGFRGLSWDYLGVNDNSVAVRPITWITIEEIKDGNWGAAGRVVRLEDLAKLVKGGREEVEKAVTPA